MHKDYGRVIIGETSCNLDYEDRYYLVKLAWMRENPDIIEFLENSLLPFSNDRIEIQVMHWARTYVNLCLYVIPTKDEEALALKVRF